VFFLQLLTIEIIGLVGMIYWTGLSLVLSGKGWLTDSKVAAWSLVVNVGRVQMGNCSRLQEFDGRRTCQ
jgi:hypothetical protein